MSIWVLSGEDAFLRQNQRQQLLAAQLAAMPEAMQNMMYSQLNNPSIELLTDTLLAQVLAIGGTPLLEVNTFDGFKTAINSDKARDALQEALGQTQKNVMFVTPKLDKKLKWVKWLLGQPQVHHEAFDPLAFWEQEKAIARLMQLAKQQHITLHPNAAQHMVSSLGMDFYALSQVLQQAYTLANGQAVNNDHVTPFLPSGDNLFESLAEWVQQARGPQRWQTLDHVLETDAPHRVLALTQKMLHDYWLVKTMTDQGQTPSDIATWVGKKPGWVSMQLRWLQRVPAQRLSHLKSQALQTENAIKSGQMEARLALELLWAS